MHLIAAEDGNTLVKTPQPVPGGLTGIVAPSWWPSILRDLFNETINNGFTGRHRDDGARRPGKLSDRQPGQPDPDAGLP